MSRCGQASPKKKMDGDENKLQQIICQHSGPEDNKEELDWCSLKYENVLLKPDIYIHRIKTHLKK